MAGATEFFVELVLGVRKAKTVLVAHRLGIFTALDEGPRSAVELAEKIGCAPRAVDILLRACAAIELLVFDGERFQNAPLASRHLVRGRPGYVGHNLDFQEMLWGAWSGLEEIVRHGRPPRSLDVLLSGVDPTFPGEYVRGMHDIAGPFAREVVRLLGDRPLRRVLDVGGGPGTFTLALLDAHPGARATLLDLPATLDVTRQILAGHPARDRIDLVPGSYHEDRYGADRDLVLMSHVTHDESPEAVAAMIGRAARALAPGGRLAIHDFTVADDGCGPAWAALFSVNLLTYTDGGRTYSVAEYRRFLADAGLRAVAVHPVLEGQVKNPTVLVVGERA